MKFIFAVVALVFVHYAYGSEKEAFAVISANDLSINIAFTEREQGGVSVKIAAKG